ncbi:hypothetical protein IJ818_05660 [bacterium]|nr:hypothetical protein [bacterium]
MKDTVLSPHEVREILNSDNKEIIRLCKLAAITPRQNEKGFTYFSYDEVKRLKELRDNYRQSVISSNQFRTLEMIKSAFYQLEDNMPESAMIDINNKFKKLEQFFEEHEKCKSENASLKLKMAQISKQNCYLKDQLKEFKPMGMGVYIKLKKKDYSI